MLFLWKMCKLLIHRKQSPSPKRHMNYIFNVCSIKRASVPAFMKKTVIASMTVEAAFVLPLFLFFFINMGSAIEMIRLHGNLQLALWNCGNPMCVYGYLENTGEEDRDKGKSGIVEEMGDIALTYTYVKEQVTEYAGREYLNNTPLVDGEEGLLFWESDVGTLDTVVSGEVLDIVMTYQVSPFLKVPYVKPFRMFNRYYGRMWTGYDINITDNRRENIVYVAENAQVYHETENCTHLKLSVREVTMKELSKMKNSDGKKYKQCSKCKNKKMENMVFITDEGSYYHRDKQCSGLKRTIYTMLRELAEERYKSCSRCGK